MFYGPAAVEAWRTRRGQCRHEEVVDCRYGMPTAQQLRRGLGRRDQRGETKSGAADDTPTPTSGAASRAGAEASRRPMGPVTLHPER